MYRRAKNGDKVKNVVRPVVTAGEVKERKGINMNYVCGILTLVCLCGPLPQ